MSFHCLELQHPWFLHAATYIAVLVASCRPPQTVVATACACVCVCVGGGGGGEFDVAYEHNQLFLGSLCARLVLNYTWYYFIS